MPLARHNHIKKLFMRHISCVPYFFFISCRLIRQYIAMIIMKMHRREHASEEHDKKC